ncbi:hypothetical protein PSO31014_04331 [Pandoraea soli]|uniref:Uncharacterized protein n=1 Tax=Pandoraea soli TaxID=2508293 RepID=A0ABY6WFN5_9BURK|nr:hypothetical protein PSO31014_04331 [Pandoraea soli]
MGHRARLRDRMVVVRIALQAGRRQQFEPLGRLARGAVRAVATLERRGRREVAGEVAGVEVNAKQHARSRQLDHTPVVAVHTLATCLPTIHPLAVVVVFARDEDGRLWIEHALFGREELVAGLQRLRTQARISQVDVTAHKFRCVRVLRGEGHVAFDSRSSCRRLASAIGSLDRFTLSLSFSVSVPRWPACQLRQCRSRSPQWARKAARHRALCGLSQSRRLFPTRPRRGSRRSCPASW